MLATKAAETGTASTTDAASAAMPRYNVAAATTEMMWACVVATARVTVASTARGLELWSHLLRAPAGNLPGLGAGAEAAAQPAGTSSAAERKAPAAIASTPADPTTLASYRSAGGHAATQVTVSD
jgi:hypothetical protein